MITVPQVRNIYKSLGCFLHMSHREMPGPSSWAIVHSWKIDSIKLELAPFMSDKLIDVVAYSSDGVTIKALNDLLRHRTQGKNPFSSEIHQFAYMVITADRNVPSYMVPAVKEHMVYIHWTFLSQNLLNAA